MYNKMYEEWRKMFDRNKLERELNKNVRTVFLYHVFLITRNLKIIARNQLSLYCFIYMKLL